MGLTYDATIGLFRQGEFLQLIRASASSERELCTLEPRHRVVLANAMALTGELEEAQRIAEMDRNPPSAAAVRAQAESTFAVVSRRDGDHGSAVRHAQAAVHLAQEAGDRELVAWMQLHLFRLLIDGGPIDKILAALPDVRRLVARAGVSQASAYLHTCVSVLEGQTGRLDEARRHCDIAESLLTLSSNTWLTGAIQLNRGVMALLNCEFEKAADLITLAKEAASKSGHAQTAIAAQTNLGHLQLILGQFKKSRETFSALMADPRVNPYTKLAAADGLARVHLALGEIEACREALRSISAQTGQHSWVTSIYHVRWAAITQARLQIRHAAAQEAINGLSVAEEDSRRLGG